MACYALNVLRAEGLSKTHLSPAGKVTALEDFSHSFEKGRMVAVTGPSGSGKSTLLNLLAGLDTPSGGRVWLGEVELTSLPEKKRAELRLHKLGFVFQSFNLVTVLSAQQNVALPLGLAGVGRRERTARALELLARFGLENRSTHLPFKLSGGEKQRVALARALANSPDIVFADEPTGNLDSKSGAVVLQALRSVAAEGRTVIIVTHDPSVAAAADETIRLHDGRRVDP